MNYGRKNIVGEDGKISTEKQEYERDEFWATTSNKQPNNRSMPSQRGDMTEAPCSRSALSWSYLKLRPK
jgi:hypothetical protein